MKTLQGLCIGAGYFSQFHFDAWQRIPEVQIVGVCDTNQDAAQARADEFGIPQVFGDVSDALRDLDLDFVDIITRPDTHMALVEQIAPLGLAMICQKPLAPDAAQLNSIMAAIRQAKVPFMVHENFRFQPWYREIKKLLNDGVIGSKLHSLYFQSRPGDGWGADAYLDRQPYFREMPRLLIYETGVHFIDTFRYLAGEVEEVFAVLRRLNPVIQGEDTGLVTFRFASGAIGVWDANRYNEGTAADPRYTFGRFLVEGDGGSIRLDDDGRIFVHPLGQSEAEHQYARNHHGFASDCVFATQSHFVDQLRAGADFETSGEEYLKTLKVQEAVYLSAEKNVPVSPTAVSSSLGG